MEQYDTFGTCHNETAVLNSLPLFGVRGLAIDRAVIDK